MDEQRFDQLTRAWSSRVISRRETLRLVGGGLVASVLAVVGRSGVAAQTCLAEGAARHSSDQCCLGRCKKKKGHTRGHCSCPATRQCETFCCGGDHFCCNPLDQICCPSDAQCCNAGDGTGSCCTSPGSCSPTYGDETAPASCCPPERTLLTSTNTPVCCPAGTVAVGTVTTNGGPCCPEASACNGHCCAAGSVCISGSCCAESAAAAPSAARRPLAGGAPTAPAPTSARRTSTVRSAASAGCGPWGCGG